MNTTVSFPNAQLYESHVTLDFAKFINFSVLPIKSEQVPISWSIGSNASVHNNGYVY